LAVLAAALGAVMAAAPVVAPMPVAANCIGPMLEEVDGSVGRGRVFELRGGGWGDDCHDTGERPAGEGELGVPLQDLPIRFEQEGRTWELGSVDADDAYVVRAEVVVPVDAHPGRASVTVGEPGDRAVSAAIDLLVSGDDPVDPPETTVAPAALDDDADVHDAAQAEASDRSVGTWVIVGGVALLVVVVALVLARLVGGDHDRDGGRPRGRPPAR